MLLDVPYRRVASLDLPRLLRVVERLRPLYESPEAPLWSVIAERMKWVGQTERPPDVSYRKMAPSSYVQLCIRNDEEPRSPWAIDVPEAVLSRDEQAEVARDLHAACREVYGEGTIFLMVFAVLGPGGIIPPHRDLPHDVNKRAFSHRLHIPLTAATEAEFVLKGETVSFDLGGIYEIDNMSTHSVTHRGKDHRVSVVIDYCPAANLERRNAPSPPKVKLDSTTAKNS
ncbi:hypothetical protein BH09MYX1_BH09MYX1_36860 [soil metagenome]